jgi:hypothetical protein
MTTRRAYQLGPVSGCVIVESLTDVAVPVFVATVLEQCGIPTVVTPAELDVLGVPFDGWVLAVRDSDLERAEIVLEVFWAALPAPARERAT